MPPCLNTGAHEWILGDADRQVCRHCGVRLDFLTAGGQLRNWEEPMTGRTVISARLNRGVEASQAITYELLQMADQAHVAAEAVRNVTNQVLRIQDSEFVNGDGHGDGEAVEGTREAVDPWISMEPLAVGPTYAEERRRMMTQYQQARDVERRERERRLSDRCATCGLPVTSDAHLARCAGYSFTAQQTQAPSANPDRDLLESLQRASNG